MAGGIFMFDAFMKSDSDIEKEKYERKLELIRSVREENRLNRERIGRRHQLLYGDGKQGFSPSYGGYQSDAAYQDSYGGMADYQDMDERATGDPHAAYHFFALRALVAAVCILAFWGIKTHKINVPSSMNEETIKQYITEDFSKQVVDYIEDFTYTFGYEKTSAY